MPSTAAVRLDEPIAMRFIDFSIRAWREGPYLQVIAHSTPAGALRHPVAVRLGVFAPADYRIEADAPLERGVEVGRDLARLVLPTEIWRLLGESLAGIAPSRDLGLRLRLCLDDDLIDLPWEFLYRPDMPSTTARSGFLLSDARICLVREPPSVVATQPPSDRPQRGLFVGTLFADGTDGWSVQIEHASLSRALRPVGKLLAFEFARADDDRAVERSLAAGCEVFHYAGHVDIVAGDASLVQLARAEGLSASGSKSPHEFELSTAATTVAGAGGGMEALSARASWATAEGLARQLQRAGTRLVVLNACNSGAWPLVRPLMHAGVPAVVGVQGLVSNVAALNFAEKLYQSLAVGLSLDEALTYARHYVMQPERSYYPCDWGRFMAYMPTDVAVVFPRAARGTIGKRQRELRAGREQTLRDVRALAERLDGAELSRMLSEVASRSVLILGRFTSERKAVLDVIARELRAREHGYVPIVFDFEKPSDRDLIESVLRFAAVSRFVVADLSDPKSVPAELQQIVPSFPSLPVVPIIEATQREYPVADNILRRASVHSVVQYRDCAHLRTILDEQVIAPAEMLYAALKPRAVM